MTRFMVFATVGAVAGFGSVFFERPGMLIAGAALAVLALTVRRLPEDLMRVGAYLFAGGLVGLSIVGPAVEHPDPTYFYSTWAAAWLYAGVCLVGGALCAAVALVELRRHRRRI